nr:immunoglobulin heavy chain junction region [Mus musculus]
CARWGYYGSSYAYLFAYW